MPAQLLDRIGHVERKAFPLSSFKIAGDDAGSQRGEYEAIVSVFGNVDDGGDRVIAGAFVETIKENPYPPVVWSHMWGIPPIGETLEWAENDVGLWVRGRLFVGDGEDHPTARQCYAGMKAPGRPLREFSFAYWIIDAGWVTENEVQIYELTKLGVYEHGPCLVGMNRETELLQVASHPAAGPVSGGKAPAPATSGDTPGNLADVNALLAKTRHGQGEH